MRRTQSVVSSFGASAGLLGINVEQSTPDLSGLASPLLAGMDHPARSHTEPLDCPASNASDVVSTVCSERPFRVLVLGLRLLRVIDGRHRGVVLAAGDARTGERPQVLQGGVPVAGLWLLFRWCRCGVR
jgi:hypothetical protein